jgi:hypothetical protein
MRASSSFFEKDLLKLIVDFGTLLIGTEEASPRKCSRISFLRC